jgi:hypothetical protein
MRYSIIKDEQVSPECCLARKIIAFFEPFSPPKICSMVITFLQAVIPRYLVRSYLFKVEMYFG